MGRTWKWLTNWSAGAILSWLLHQIWILVVGSGVIAALFARAQNLPWLYVYIIALAVAGLVTWILAQNSIRRSLSSPKFKLVVETMNPTHWPDGDQQKIKPHLVLRNLGNFPIEVDCAAVDWSLNGEGGVEKKGIQTTAVIPPLGQQVLHGAVFSRTLAIAGEDQNKAVKISVHVNIRYGRPGSLRYKHIQDYTLNCFIDPNVRSNDQVWIEQVGRGQFA